MALSDSPPDGATALETWKLVQGAWVTQGTGKELLWPELGKVEG